MKYHDTKSAYSITIKLISFVTSYMQQVHATILHRFKVGGEFSEILDPNNIQIPMSEPIEEWLLLEYNHDIITIQARFACIGMFRICTSNYPNLPLETTFLGQF